MDKTSEKITKDPKRVEAGRKGRENYMNKYKESILHDAKKGSRDTINTSNETTNATKTATTPATSTNHTTTTTRSYDTYVYVAYNIYQAKNKKLVNEKQDQPPKRHHML